MEVEEVSYVRSRHNIEEQTRHRTSATKSDSSEISALFVLVGTAASSWLLVARAQGFFEP